MNQALTHLRQKFLLASVLSLLLGGVLSVISLAEAQGNPSTSAPEALLAVSNLPETRQLFQQAEALLLAATPKVNQLRQKLAANSLSAGDASAVSSAYLQCKQVQRLAGLLKFRGEPVGHDFSHRITPMSQDLIERIGPAVAGKPGFQAARLKQEMQEIHQNGLQLRPQLKQLVAQKDYVAAQRGVDEIIDALDARGVFFKFDPAKLYLPFVGFQAEEVAEPLLALRQETWSKELEPFVAARHPHFAALSAEIVAATAELKKSGKAPWHGTDLTGPELVTKIVQRLTQLQSGLEVCHTLEVLRLTKDRPELSNIMPLHQEKEAFMKALPEMLAALIEADAAKVSLSDAVTTRAAYVQALAPLVAWGIDKKVRKQLEESLKKFEERSSTCKERVESYTRQTEDWLRWKTRLAQRQAKTRQVKAPDFQTRFETLAISRPEQPGFVREFDAGLPATVWHPTSLMMTNLAAEILARPVSTGELLGAFEGMSVTRFNNECYCHAEVPFSPRLAAKIAETKRQLLLTAENPPLNLDMAAAKFQLEKGNFERVGGELSEVRVEPLLSRLASLPTGAGSQFDWGSVLVDANDKEKTARLLVHGYLQVRWVQHTCFILDLFAPPGTVTPPAATGPIVAPPSDG